MFEKYPLPLFFQGLLETKEKNQYMMGEKQYLNELEKNLKEQ